MSESEIAAVVVGLFEAENAADAIAAGRYLSENFIAITRARGVEQGRQALLEELAHPENPSLHRRVEERPSVRQSGDLAVARSVVSILDGSPPFATRFRNVHVLAREAGGWKCISWQVTKLVPDPHTPVV